MTTKTIEIQDTLQENVDSAIGDLQSYLLQEISNDWQYIDIESFIDEINDDGFINELVDSATPIYTKEIQDTLYLHREEISEAYKTYFDNLEGAIDKPEIMIYAYIEQEVWAWLDDVKDGIQDELDDIQNAYYVYDNESASISEKLEELAENILIDNDLLCAIKEALNEGDLFDDIAAVMVDSIRELQ